MVRHVRRSLDRRRDDAGFSLIELTVAMFITLLVVTALVGVFIKSLTGVALGKQRQAATALATSVMEQLRAVDYGTLSAGMVCSDLPGDSRIVVTGTCGAGGTVTFAPGVSGISEPVKVQASTPATTVPPLFPHISSQSLEGVTYRVAAYLTTAPTAQESFNLTVLVDWSSAVSSGTKTVVQRSAAYSPTRCLSSATHPFSGACQAAFRGEAGVTNAGLRVFNPDDPSSPILGLSGTELSLGLPTLSTSAAAEQINKLAGSAGTTLARIAGATPTEQTTGGVVGSTAADNDPSSVAAGTSTATVSQSTLTPLSAAGTAGALRLVPGAADGGALDTRVAATTTCLDAAGIVLPAAGRPCSSGSIQQSGTAASMVLDPQVGPDVTLASIGASPAPMRGVAARLTTPGSTACPTASGLGCVTSQVSRQLGDVLVGGLPAAGAGGSLPAGWSGSLLRVTGVVESAFAESGFGARPNPGFTRSAGTLSYYDGAISGYRDVLLKDLTADLTVTLPAVTGTYLEGGQTVRVTVSGTVRAGSRSLLAPTPSAPDPACKSTACESTASVASTVTADLLYEVTVDSVTTTRFALVADLGALTARSSYKAAFDA